ncbi:hypothetical protein CP970_01250 [Streptomyces kanamyceticus]|uniref:Lipoprotein n=1 Tax=Streptomyces kanamyceticus TaxID=1967 RepID=A0A5J6G944_STRKN|nr:hypothetical protein [Streptomyces kanamyceticus]QEU89756.1 hypothetical protein CP970_01250 [Streptomyces kanamyceticus]
MTRTTTDTTSSSRTRAGVGAKYRGNAALFASLAAAGALLLSACGGGDDSGSGAKSDGSHASSSANDQAADSGYGGSGSMDLAFKSGTAKRNSAPAKTGDWANPPGKPAAKPVQRKWVQLSAGRAGALDPVVVNGAGFTLYRFDKDTAAPSKSNCNDACATTWPPVLVNPGGKIFVDGVDPSAVGVITRDDGTHQVTVGGWPVYRFSKDLKPGDTNGQGVGGTWFGVQPDGQKAGQPAGQDETAPDEAQQAPATSAVLFDDANFSDNGPAQGVAGKGCQNVARPKVTSSISMSGSAKIWSGRDCTGESKVVNGDVADLATVGFDNKISSVKFG